VKITPWKILASRYVVRDEGITLRADRCETGSGVVLDPYYVQEPCDWVQAVAFDSQDRLLIIRQYRHGSRAIGVELPCGKVEPGETAADAVARELLEETGCTSAQLTPLPVLSPNTASFTNTIYTFVATNTRQVRQQALSETEQIDFEFVSIPQVLGLIDSGEFKQALHVASIFLALRSREMCLLRVKGSS
jgi:8-oxo-dGTP pyrophosphatase MutT (NUDIX family)